MNPHATDSSANERGGVELIQPKPTQGRSDSSPRLVIVSNRVSLPNGNSKGDVGGLAVAIREAFRSYHGIWFGWSGKTASQHASAPKVIDDGSIQYALMDLTSVDRQEYYNGFANRALWPTMHYRVGLSDFSRTDYAGYLRVNRTFALALKKLIGPADLVWVHDYHLIPIGAELRSLGLTNLIGYFHHIQWPAPEVFATLPGSRDLLRGMMDFNLIGVQTDRDADNLRRGLMEEIGAIPHNADTLSASHLDMLRIANRAIGRVREEMRERERRSTEMLAS